MNHWMLVSSPENFEISRGLGFGLAGMQLQYRKKAIDVRIGDEVNSNVLIVKNLAAKSYCGCGRSFSI